MQAGAVTFPRRADSQPRPQIKARDGIPITERCNPSEIPNSSNSKGVEIDPIERNPDSLTYQELIHRILQDLEQPSPPPSPFWLWFRKLDRQFVQAVTKLLDATCPF